MLSTVADDSSDDGPNAAANAIGYAKFYRGSHDAVIYVHDELANVIRDARTLGRFQRVVIITILSGYFLAGFDGTNNLVQLCVHQFRSVSSDARL